MATIRGADIKIELYLSGAWTELTCDVTTAEWQWGAPEALGPLTECEGGTLRVSLYDPTRKYDPDNPSSPLLGALKVGLGFRVTVDAAAAWTGVLQSWGWDRGSKIADLNGVDPIGMLSMRALPAAQQLLEAPNAVTSAVQAQFLLDVVEWPSAKRYFPNGTAGQTRGNHTVEGSALDGLGRIRFAELGRLYPMRDGRIGWHDRTGPTPPASSATINCNGVDLTDMWKAMGLGRLRNHVVIGENGGNYGPVLPPDEYRSVTTNFFFLALADMAFGLEEHGEWAYWILDRLNPPPVLTMLDTLLPQGAEIKTLTTAEFGHRWTVQTAGSPDVLVQVFGMRVAIAPDWIEVDVVTEDVVTPTPVLVAVPTTGSSHSGHLLSTNSINYSNARAGPATEVHTDAAFGSTQQYVGQYLQAGPVYGVHEAFLAFDTSSIPAGATITKAILQAQIVPDWPATTLYTWVNFTIQARSYPSGGWRPSLTLADWIPGANLGSYPLRATLDTARGTPAGGAVGGAGGAFDFTDVSLASAIVKGGTTELVLVSSRTVAGTGPASTDAYEDVRLEYVRLRVYYTTGGVAPATTVAQYLLNEGSGTTALAAVGGRNGTYIGSPTFVSGGVTLNGTSQYVSVPDHATFDFIDNFRIEADIIRGATGAVRTVLSKGVGSWNLRIESDGRFSFVKDFVSVVLTSPAALDTSRHWIAAEKAGSTVKLFLDGVQVATTASAPALTATATPFAIGTDIPGSLVPQDYFNGTLYEVKLSTL